MSLLYDKLKKTDADLLARGIVTQEELDARKASFSAPKTGPLFTHVQPVSGKASGNSNGKHVATKPKANVASPNGKPKAAATAPPATAAEIPPRVAATPIYDFLSLVVGEGKTILIRPIETWTENGDKKSRVIYGSIAYPSCMKLTVGMALDKLLPMAERERANLFFGICPRIGGNGHFDKAWAIRTVPTLWSDVDGCTPDEAQERCAKAGLPAPSVVVSSGNGAHLYWLLQEPLLIDDAPKPPPVCRDWVDQPNGKKKKREWFKDPGTGEKLYLDQRGNVPPLSEKALHVQDVLAGIAAKIGGDHTQDLSRLLRLPGTLNRKDQRNGRQPVPCEILSMDETLRYQLADFERFAKESPNKTKREQLRAIPLPTPRRVSPGRRDKLNKLVTACALAPIGERSQRDFDLCCFAIRHGVAQAELWGSVQGIGKFSEAGERYFLRTWTAAEAEAREQIYRKVEKKHGARASAANGNGNGHAALNGKVARVAEPDNFTEEDGNGMPSIVTDDGQTDIANARRFVYLHGESVRYCAPWAKWLTWDGRRWAVDRSEEIELRAKGVSSLLWQQIATLVASGELAGDDMGVAVGQGHVERSRPTCVAERGAQRKRSHDQAGIA